MVAAPEICLTPPLRSAYAARQPLLRDLDYVYYRDHGPAHFHAVYAGQEVQVGIDTLRVLHGGLPSRALTLVLEWASMHQAELRQVWEQASRRERLDRIAPLE